MLSCSCFAAGAPKRRLNVRFGVSLPAPPRCAPSVGDQSRALAAQATRGPAAAGSQKMTRQNRISVERVSVEEKLQSDCHVRQEGAGKVCGSSVLGCTGLRSHV